MVHKKLAAMPDELREDVVNKNGLTSSRKTDTATSDRDSVKNLKILRHVERPNDSCSRAEDALGTDKTLALTDRDKYKELSVTDKGVKTVRVEDQDRDETRRCIGPPLLSSTETGQLLAQCHEDTSHTIVFPVCDQPDSVESKDIHVETGMNADHRVCMETFNPQSPDSNKRWVYGRTSLGQPVVLFSLNPRGLSSAPVFSGQSCPVVENMCVAKPPDNAKHSVCGGTDLGESVKCSYERALSTTSVHPDNLCPAAESTRLDSSPPLAGQRRAGVLPSFSNAEHTFYKTDLCEPVAMSAFTDLPNHRALSSTSIHPDQLYPVAESTRVDRRLLLNDTHMSRIPPSINNGENVLYDQQMDLQNHRVLSTASVHPDELCPVAESTRVHSGSALYGQTPPSDLSSNNNAEYIPCGLSSNNNAECIPCGGMNVEPVVLYKVSNIPNHRELSATSIQPSYLCPVAESTRFNGYFTYSQRPSGFLSLANNAQKNISTSNLSYLPLAESTHHERDAQPRNKISNIPNHRELSATSIHPGDLCPVAESTRFYGHCQSLTHSQRPSGFLSFANTAQNTVSACSLRPYLPLAESTHHERDVWPRNNTESGPAGSGEQHTTPTGSLYQHGSDHEDVSVSELVVSLLPAPYPFRDSVESDHDDNTADTLFLQSDHSENGEDTLFPESHHYDIDTDSLFLESHHAETDTDTLFLESRHVENDTDTKTDSLFLESHHAENDTDTKTDSLFLESHHAENDTDTETDSLFLESHSSESDTDTLLLESNHFHNSADNTVLDLHNTDGDTTIIAGPHLFDTYSNISLGSEFRPMSPQQKTVINNPGFERSDRWRESVWETYRASISHSSSFSEESSYESEFDSLPNSLPYSLPNKNKPVTDSADRRPLIGIKKRFSLTLKGITPNLRSLLPGRRKSLGGTGNCQPSTDASLDEVSRLKKSGKWRDGLLIMNQDHLHKTLQELKAEDRVDMLPLAERGLAETINEFLHQEKKTKTYIISVRLQKKMILLANMCLIQVEKVPPMGIKLTKGWENRFPQVKDILWIHTN